MSALALAERPLRLWDDEGRAAPPASRGPAGSPGAAGPSPAAADASPEGFTLAHVLASAWEGLAARTTVACPLCHGELEPRPGGGRCRTCGTSLS